MSLGDLDTTAEPVARTAWRRRFVEYVALTLAFGLAHTQAPLYYSNQHQYFLHGLARGGLGDLDRDWLANTADPTPVFSTVVAVTHRYLGDWLFQLYFLLLLGLYANSLVGIFRHLTGRKWTSPPGLLFVTLLTLIHSGALRLLSAHLLGKDYPWYVQAGVAGQYVLGPGLQPSVFGVFLLAAIHAFLLGRPWLAAMCVGLACSMHSTYLPSGAFLTLAFMYALWCRGESRRALMLGVLTLLLVVPVLAYDLIMFAPSSPDVFAEAQRIIAHERIPHHAQFLQWFDPIAILQVLWIVLAAILVRGKPLMLLVMVPLNLSAGFTLLQAFTRNDTLALLFPWRTTAILVPLATTIVCARFANWSARPRAVTVCIAALGGLVAGGIVIMVGGHTYRTNTDEMRLLDYTRAHKQPGDLYLIPVEVPKLGSAPRGVVSTSFTPPPRRDHQQGLISVDLQRFRLYTGTPIFVDFKSIPYKDREVLDWWDRLHQVQWLYRQLDWSALEVRHALKLHGITHVVTTANKPLPGAGDVVYQDAYYIVYRVR
jgi:hypothetical protein